MGDQLLRGLPVRVQPFVRLVVRRKIIGPQWEFPVGMKLEGMKDPDGTWRVWPPEQEHAFLVGVPRWYVKRDKSNKKHSNSSAAANS